jgi:arylsulfatase A-like enzyme
VGEIVRALRQQGLLDNTLIVLTSDNGPVLDDGYDDGAEQLVGEHSPMGGLCGGKYSAFEAGTRVPFIVHWPAKVKPSGISEALVSQIDFLEAMAKLIGLNGCDSLSSDGNADELAVWLGDSCGGRPFAVEMASNHTLSLIYGDWKYIEPKGGPAMVPWGPKIATGYSTEPQLFKKIDGEFDETRNVAAENMDMVEVAAKLLDAIKSEKSLWFKTDF